MLNGDGVHQEPLLPELMTPVQSKQYLWAGVFYWA